MDARVGLLSQRVLSRDEAPDLRRELEERLSEASRLAFRVAYGVLRQQRTPRTWPRRHQSRLAVPAQAASRVAELEPIDVAHIQIAPLALEPLQIENEEGAS